MIMSEPLHQMGLSGGHFVANIFMPVSIFRVP